jgi:hypothetical protein
MLLVFSQIHALHCQRVESKGFLAGLGKDDARTLDMLSQLQTLAQHSYPIVRTRAQAAYVKSLYMLVVLVMYLPVPTTF